MNQNKVKKHTDSYVKSMEKAHKFFHKIGEIVYNDGYLEWLQKGRTQSAKPKITLTAPSWSKREYKMWQRIKYLRNRNSELEQQLKKVTEERDKYRTAFMHL